MSRPLRLRGAVALVLGCVLGGLGTGSLFAGSALADDGSGSASTPPPVSVTIPNLGANGQTPTPTASSSPSSVSSSPPVHRGGGGGRNVTAPPHQPCTEPSVPKYPAIGTLKVTIALARVFRSGDRMTVTAKGFDAGEKVQLALYFEHGKPVTVGNFAAGASGSFSKTFVLPQLDAGTETVQLTGWDSSKVAIGRFLLGASWVAQRPSVDRSIWLWVGGLAGLGAFAALICFGVVSLRKLPVAEAGV
jgi:hypothetical protein